MYCERCRTLRDGTRCPVCRSKKLREVQPDDLCLLTDKDSVWSGLLEDVLHQHHVPFITQNYRGAALSILVGSFGESVLFYVPHSHLRQAQEIVEELFPSEPIDEA